jgi:CRP-like cAMP-binding protein
VAIDLVDARFIRTLRYGYVHGMEEQIVPSLTRFELDLAEVTDDQLEFADLSAFDAIVIGPNAYAVRPALRRSAARLLDFVAQGGTLLVQYQTYGYDAGGLTPFPFRFSQPHDRVTDPQAPVMLADPAHPVLHAPNAIGPADFDGWVHDRGLYFMGEWDRRYAPVLASADAGEPLREGGLLCASYGRGTYVYAAYSFHRQIPAGVPGAVRLFANLLALAEVRVRERMARLGALELFAFMTEPQLYEAARSVSERWVDAGAYLAREGERGHEMFIVVDGTVEVLQSAPGGDRLVHVASPGEELGELTLLADIPRTASLRAATDVVVLVIRDDALKSWLLRHPDLARGMMRRLAHRIVETTGQLS